MIKINYKLNLILLVLLAWQQVSYAQVPEDFALNVCAKTRLHTSDTNRTIVTINWRSAGSTPFSTSYRFKTKNDLFWGAPIALAATDTFFIDTIPTGSEREYLYLQEIRAPRSGSDAHSHP